MYQIVKDAQAVQAKESLTQIQQGFLARTEKLLRQHQQRAEIHDGLKGLTNQEVINKVVESPSKLKRQAKGLLHVL
jgi:hypothetical protein